MPSCHSSYLKLEEKGKLI
uniref:Uncharacterized protein n=1 Tax=Anguilla anguilla TaxID=7936 RepID=A0A0E9T7J5_ANGAN